MDGQPSLWCPWEPSCDGGCLVLCNDNKISAPVTWLRYLVGHFLAPEAMSSTSGLPDFADFTYDHQVGGAVAVHSLESNELSLVRADCMIITEEIVVPAGPEIWGPSRGYLP